MEVVVMAKMVPTGMDFWASRRSPDLLEPAMMPATPRETTVTSFIQSFKKSPTKKKIVQCSFTC